jgi:hypothetical protein
MVLKWPGVLAAGSAAGRDVDYLRLWRIQL